MGGRHGPSRRAGLCGVLVLGLALVLSLPSVAAAANTATFSYRAPASGSSLTNTRPTISVVVYDKYGVRGLRGTAYKMAVDSVQVPVRLTYYTGYGYKKFRLSYRPTTPLTDGIHNAAVYVKDLAGLRSFTSWKFRVDTRPPTTTVNGTLPKYPGSFFLQLTATDAGVGVANTYYKVDGGPTMPGTFVFGSLAIGTHTVNYWSVDKLGNAEPMRTLTATVVSRHSTPAAFRATCGGTTGCHTQDLPGIHANVGDGCFMCHGVGRTPSDDCSVCHTIRTPMHTPHVTIGSSSPSGQTCTQSTCHGANAVSIHAGCATCHASTNQDVLDVVAAGGATCESCHAGGYSAIHAGATLLHQRTPFACSAAGCHPKDVAVVHTAWANPPGCAACHGAGRTPSKVCSACHNNIGTIHDYPHVDASGTKSTACTECHGTDLPTVHEAVGCLCHSASYLVAEMSVLKTAGTAECVDCHTGDYAAHSFNQGKAGGHNTTTYGTVGAFTKWDGSEGVVVKDSLEDTITQEWPLPTSGVFWSDSKGLALNGAADGSYSLNPTDSPSVALANKGFSGDPTSKIRTDVGWGSVITCQDCHTGLALSMGPQGANAGQVGLDPNFPDDWTKGEITSFDPTGMRSIATTAGSPNPYYKKLGSKVWPPEGSSGTTEKANVFVNGSLLATGTINEGGFYDTTANSSNGYAAGVVTGRFICQKCHKLTNSFQGLGIEGNGRGFRSNNFAYMGFSNEAHMEHHADMITGQGNCVSCHIAIPHGWKRPRLLVYESDPAPYKVQWVFAGYQTLALAKSATADLSNGNWGYVGTGGTSTYKLIGAPIPNGSVGSTSSATAVPPNTWSPSVNGLDNALPQGTVVDNTGKTYSSHLEKISASDMAHKELVVGPADLFGVNDTFNGTTWNKWLRAAEGSEWHPDTSPNALYSDDAIQNNCTACTSAGLTHSDTGGSSEGVAETNVVGRTPVGGIGTWTAVPFWK